MSTPPIERGSSPTADDESEAEELERLVRVDEIVTAAIERARTGEAISIASVVREHPDLEGELWTALHAVASMERTVDRATPQAPGLPEKIGSYEIVGELGRGGMGIVYEAHDSSLDRRVAIKLLPLAVSLNRGFSERFRREAHVAARLEHPHVVPIFSVDEADGRQFLVMKLVDGLGLDELMELFAQTGSLSASRSNVDAADGRAHRLARQLAAGRLGSFGLSSDSSADGRDTEAEQAATLGSSYHRNVARVGLAVADALSYAHARGVLHRDIKPGNILVDRRGSVWVTDFGLAKLDEADDLTRDGDLVGTLRYMSPEQFEGHAEPRSDVYALGLVLYEMLTLRRAMKSDSRAELIHEVLYVVPKSPDSVRSVVPQDLARIVMKAIAKLPEERYRTAQAMAADLRAFLEGRPIAAREPSVLYLTRVAVNRNRPLFAAIAVLLVALIVGAVAYVTQLRRSARAETTLAYRANLAAAAASLENSDVPTARAHLLDCAEERRGWEWEQLEASLDQSLRTLASIGSPVRSLRYEGDAVYVAHHRGVTLLDGEARTDVTLPGGNGELPEVINAWPYEGGWLSFQYRTGYWRSPREGYAAATVPDLEKEPVAGMANLRIAPSAIAVDFAPRADRTAVAEPNGKLFVVDPRTLEILASAPTDQENVEGLVLAEDARTCWTGSLDGSVKQWNLDDMSSRTVFVSPAGLKAIAVSNDGSMLAVAGSDHSVYLVLLENPDEEIYQFVGHEGEVRTVCFSQDGTLLASSGIDKRMRVWDVESGEPVMVLTGHARGAASIAFNADGDRFASGSLSGAVKEWHVGASGGRALVRGHLADVAALDHAARGDRFASGARDGTIRVVDAASLRLDVLLIGHREELNGLVWHSDDSGILAGDRSGLVIDWDVRAARPRWELRLDGVISRPAISSDGASAFVGAFSGEIVRVRLEDGEVIFGTRLEGKGVRSIAVTPDGKRVLAGTLDGWLIAFDADSLEEIERAKRHENRITRVLFDPAGRTLTTSSLDGTVAFSPAHELAAERRTQLGGEGNAWNSDGLDCACYSPDGKLLAVASNSWIIRLLDAETGEPLLDLAGHRDWVRRVSFAPDGSSLVSTGSYASVRIWDTKTTAEREAALQARLDLERAGRALVESWIGGKVRDPDDVAAALARVDMMGDGHSDLQRATRAMLYQERDRHILEYLERGLLDPDQRAIKSADAYVRGWARRLPMNSRTHRLAAFTDQANGLSGEAERHLVSARALAVEGGAADPVLGALEAHLGHAAGDGLRVERALEAARRAIVRPDADPIDVRTAQLLLLQLEGVPLPTAGAAGR